MPSNGIDIPSLEFENQNILALREIVGRISSKESSAMEQSVCRDKALNTF